MFSLKFNCIRAQALFFLFRTLEIRAQKIMSLNKFIVEKNNLWHYTTNIICEHNSPICRTLSMGPG